MSLRLKCFGISKKVSAVLCLGILLLLGASSAWGQTSTAGTVAGLVTDEQNAVIPGAAVKVTEPSTTAGPTHPPTPPALSPATAGSGLCPSASVKLGQFIVSLGNGGFTCYRVAAQH